MVLPQFKRCDAGSSTEGAEMNEDSENQFSDQLYLLENGCNRHQNIMSDYTVEDMYHSPKDPFDG